jgi:MFS family permease
MDSIQKNRQYYKFSMYGFLKNLRFFDAFFILFLVERGMSFTQIGALYAIREITINISELPSGIIADTFGRKRSLLASFVLYIVSFIVFYFGGGFWSFLAAFIIYGTADAFRSGTHKGMIMDYLKLNNLENQKINYYGHTRSWSHKGSAISSLIAGFIVFYSGTYDNIFLYSIIPYLLNLFLILSYPKSFNLPKTKEIKKENRNVIAIFKQFFRVIKKAQVFRIVNTSATHTAYLKAVKDYIQPLLVSLSLALPIMLSIDSEKKSGLIIGIIYFFIFLLNSFASKHAAKIALIRNLNIAFVSLLAGLILGVLCGFLISYELWVIALIAFIGIHLVENVRKPVLTGYIADNVPNEILTSVISAQSLFKTILTALFAFGFGVIADIYGIAISFIAISGLILLTTVFLNLYVKRIS